MEVRTDWLIGFGVLGVRTGWLVLGGWGLGLVVGFAGLGVRTGWLVLGGWGLGLTDWLVDWFWGARG